MRNLKKIYRSVFPKTIRDKFYILRSAVHKPAAVNYGISAGPGTIIEAPRKLTGPSYITAGEYSRIGCNAWLAAYDHYAGIHYTPRLSIGSHVDIGEFACITCISEISIGDGCLLSEFVYISDHFHGFSPEGGPLRDQPLTSKGPIQIGSACFLGYRACVLPGVRLGRNCVVGANSVVTHSFPNYSMVAGNPARLIKSYSFESHDWLDVDAD